MQLYLRVDTQTTICIANELYHFEIVIPEMITGFLQLYDPVDIGEYCYYYHYNYYCLSGYCALPVGTCYT